MALRHLRALDRRTPGDRKYAVAAVGWTLLSAAGFAIHLADAREAWRTINDLRCEGIAGRHREVALANLRRAIVRTAVKAIYTGIGLDGLLNPRPPDYPPPRFVPVAGLIASVILLDLQSGLDLLDQRRTLRRFREALIRQRARAAVPSPSVSGLGPLGPHGAAGAARTAAQGASAESTTRTVAVFRREEPIE